jgi:hypothetical protein
MSQIGPKVSCFRKISPGDAVRQQKFLDQEDDQFKDNTAGPGKPANSSVMRNNNLYKIKIKVD